MKKRHYHVVRTAVLAVMLVMAGVLGHGGPAAAADAAFDLNARHDLKELLTGQIGKRVSVRTDTGEALEGTVIKVGDHLLHISKLSGKDFYDAVVRIDKITSVTLRVRGN